MDFDTTVKLTIYETIANTTHMPTSAEIARALNASPADVEGALARLHANRLIVPEPGDPKRIRMAPPFSAIETSFRVTVNEKDYYANCVWDALGIASAMHSDAVIDAEDAHTGKAMAIRVRQSRVLPRPCVIHFAVPAAHWWDDIIYT